MSSFAKDYTESLFRALGHIACIVDRDQVVAASGVSKKELWDKPISPDLESAIQARQTGQHIAEATQEIPCVPPDTLVSDIMPMASEAWYPIAVTDENNVLLGLVTKASILASLI